MSYRKNENSFSIIIPSFNQGEFLKDCLESLHSQNYDNFEIIIMDSLSTDETPKIVEFYKNKYKKITHFIQKKDDGQSDAINKGIKYSKNEWISWQNCDDLYANDQVLNQFNYIIKKNSHKKLIVGNINLVDKNLKKIRDLKYVKPNFYSLLYEEMTLTNQAAFWNKSVHNEIGYLNNYRLNFDYEWFLRILKYFPNCGVNLNYDCGIYRIHSNQKTKTQSAEDFNLKKKNKKKYGYSKKFLILKKIFLNLRRVILFCLDGNFYYVFRGLFAFLFNKKKYP